MDRAAKRAHRRHGEGAEEDEDQHIPPSQMTPEQRRHYEVMQFQKELNKKKEYFQNIEAEIVPIVEVDPKDEESTASLAFEQQPTLPAEESAREKNVKEETGSEGSSSHSGDDEGDEDAGSKKEDDPDGEKDQSGSASDEEGRRATESRSESGASQSGESQVETEQMLNERMYNEYCPADPEVVSLKRIRKLQFSKQFEKARVLLVNWQHDFNYNHILNKLCGLCAVVPPNLQAIILSLPPKATFVDTHLAEQLQKLIQCRYFN